MGVLKKLLFTVSGLIVLVIVSSFFMPQQYTVERSIIIDAETSDVYPYVVNLKQWEKWGVWFKRDPNMELSYAGPDRAIGMRLEWKSDTEGDGEMEIVQLEHNSKVGYTLYFPEMDMGSSGVVEIEATDNGSRVTWRDEGTVDNNPINKLFVLFIDDMIGPDFATGLENLKTVVENNA